MRREFTRDSRPAETREPSGRRQSTWAAFRFVGHGWSCRGVSLLSLLVLVVLVIGVSHVSAFWVGSEATPDEPVLAEPTAAPQLVIDPGVPEHYAQRAEELWPELLSAFPHQARTCLTDVRLDFVDERRLVGHGYYTPATATVVVRQTGHISGLLLHELGHHLDLSCEAEREIGAEFRTVMGLGEELWYVPETGVAEMFADAVKAYLEANPHPAGDLLYQWATAGGETAVRPTRPTPPTPVDFPLPEPWQVGP